MSADIDSVLTACSGRSALLAVIGTRVDDVWAVDALLAMARTCANHEPIVVVDLLPDGRLARLLGVDDLEGIADVFQFGASLRHVVQHVEEEAFRLVAPGASAEPATLLTDARWPRLLTEARSIGTLLVCVRADAPGLDVLSARVSSVVALASSSEIDDLDEQLAGSSTAVGWLTPPQPKARAAPIADEPEPRRTSDADFEAIRVPRNAAREALIADMRHRQRAARMRPTPALEPLPDSSAELVPTRSQAPLQTVPRARVARPDNLNEPTFAASAKPRRVKSRRLVFWGLSLAMFSALAVGAWLVVQRHLELSAEPSTSPPTPIVQKTVSPLPYSVAVEAHQQLPLAQQRVKALHTEDPEVAFYIAPTLVDSVLYYRIMAGPVADTAAAGALMRRLLANGQKTGSTQWDIHETPFAFLLGEYDGRGAAENRAKEAADVAIPAYVIELHVPNGSRRFRVYAGAYSGFAEANVMRQLLKAAGMPDSLVQRVGKN